MQKESKVEEVKDKKEEPKTVLDQIQDNKMLSSIIALSLGLLFFFLEMILFSKSAVEENN